MTAGGVLAGASMPTQGAVSSNPGAARAPAAYLATRGEPLSLADLQAHDCLLNALKSPTGFWNFTGPDGKVAIRVTGSMRANFGEPLRHAALLGHGISMHTVYMVSRDVKEK